MHCGIDIIRIINNQRVIASHLKGEHFLRLTGQLAMQMKAGGRTAGEKHPVQSWLTAERFAGFASALQ